MRNITGTTYEMRIWCTQVHFMGQHIVVLTFLLWHGGLYLLRGAALCIGIYM